MDYYLSDSLNKLAHNCGFRPHCLLGPPSVGCGHQIVIRMDMSYESICLGRVHVFRMAYLTLCSVLLEDIS